MAGVKEMVIAARAVIENLAPADVAAELAGVGALLVDVREPAESAGRNPLTTSQIRRHDDNLEEHPTPTVRATLRGLGGDGNGTGGEQHRKR